MSELLPFILAKRTAMKPIVWQKPKNSENRYKRKGENKDKTGLQKKLRSQKLRNEKKLMKKLSGVELIVFLGFLNARRANGVRL